MVVQKFSGVMFTGNTFHTLNIRNCEINVKRRIIALAKLWATSSLIDKWIPWRPSFSNLISFCPVLFLFFVSLTLIALLHLEVFLIVLRRNIRSQEVKGHPVVTDDSNGSPDKLKSGATCLEWQVTCDGSFCKLEVKEGKTYCFYLSKYHSMPGSAHIETFNSLLTNYLELPKGKMHLWVLYWAISTACSATTCRLGGLLSSTWTSGTNIGC